MDEKLYRQDSSILSDCSGSSASGNPPRLTLQRPLPGLRVQTACQSRRVREDNLTCFVDRGEGGQEPRPKGILTLTQLAHTFRRGGKGSGRSGRQVAILRP